MLLISNFSDIKLFVSRNEWFLPLTVDFMTTGSQSHPIFVKKFHRFFTKHSITQGYSYKTRPYRTLENSIFIKKINHTIKDGLNKSFSCLILLVRALKFESKLQNLT